MTIVYFIFALGLLVFVHEFGHFLAAKRQKIGVEKFSLGFGPKLFSFRKGETTYLVSALPMGGYVKLKGEDPQSSDPSDPTAYSSRPVGHRFRVIFAGPMMNLLLAAVLMPVVFMIGRPEPRYWHEAPVVMGVKKNSPAEQMGLRVGDRIIQLDGKPVENWQEVISQVILRPGEKVEFTFEHQGKTVVREVSLGTDPEHRAGTLGIEPLLFIGNEAVADGLMPHGPAEQAGIKPGDEVVRMNGVAVEDWNDMADRVNESHGKRLKIEVKRDGHRLAFPLQPIYDSSSQRWLIGIQKDFQKREGPMEERRYPWWKAVELGTKENIRLGELTLAVLGRLVTFRLSYKTLGGPIRIAQASAAAAQSGFSPFLYFLAFLSLQLGLLNLLPIPVLDGGHLLFIGVEKALRRPLSIKVRLIAEQAGFFLLVGLMVLVTLHDVDSVWGFREILEKLRGLF